MAESAVNFDFPAIPTRDAIDDVGPICEVVMGDVPRGGSMMPEGC